MFRLLRKPQPETDQATYLIVGFGNPGREYMNTRHNIGFMTIDRLCKKLDVFLGKMQANALTATYKDSRNRIILAKPQTYMNLSGQSVSGLLHFYKIPIDHLLVIHDDMDIPFGSLRIRPSGGSGGQKGLGSTIDRLGTQDFARLRMGIGRPPGRMEVTDYVLQPFSSTDQQMLDSMLDAAADAALVFIRDGLDTAMNRYNGSVEKN
ncbi:aminoacyl-tRNA hydrolase [Leptolinea tardivitalis]|uniref:Peptidyl-tRNA hydrolase n=1 Tax=Leptolinea tardivitalis TaxID=229920 RepID=A0A0P6WYU1_9CHLR|nr:aminoacyl-tRNA hydrolase [Leptolinea tardivitalis]KPL71784.1 peptidyl-tRNA hydrolase [Leptolinea tardivitalis]GAP20161.1 peptidyl-tRNA hydrolase [Leptolinea tardivitalis]